MIHILKTKIPVVPCPRPRVTKQGAFMPKKYTKCKDDLLQDFMTQYQEAPLDCPVDIHISFITTKLRRGDLSNMVKTIEDVLEGLAYYDDIQISQIKAQHRIGHTDMTYIEFTQAHIKCGFVDKVSNKLLK